MKSKAGMEAWPRSQPMIAWPSSWNSVTRMLKMNRVNGMA
jgi:hypothetical protein